MSGLKDKFLRKSFEFLKRDLERKNEGISLNIEEKYSSKNQLRDTLKSLVEDIELTTKKKVQAEFIYSELKNSIHVSEQEIESLFKSYIEDEKEITHKKKLSAELTSKSTMLEAKKIELISNKEKQKNNQQNVSKKISLEQECITDLERDIQKVENNLSVNEAKLQSLNSEVLELEKRRLKKADDLFNKENKLSTLVSELEQSVEIKEELEAQISTIDTRNVETRELLHSRRLEIARITKELTHTHSVFESSEMNLSKLIIDRDQLTSKLIELKEGQLRIDSLVNDSLQKKRDIDAELLKLDTEKGECSEALQSAKKKFDLLKTKESYEEELLNEKEREVSLLNSQLDTQKEASEELRLRRIEIKNCLSEKEVKKRNLKEDIHLIEKDIRNISLEINLIENQLKSENTLLSGLENQKFYKRENFEKEKRYLQTLEESLSRLKDVNQERSEHLLALNEEFFCQEKIIKSKQVERLTLITELKSHKDKIKGLKNFISTMDSKIENKNLVLKRAQADFTEVREVIADLELRVQRQEDKKLELEVLILKKNNSKLEAQREIDELFFQIEQSNRDEEGLEKELDTQRSNREIIGAELDKAKNILSLREESLVKIERTIARTREEVDIFVKSNFDLEQEAYQNFEKLKAERAFLGSLQEEREKESLKLQSLSRKKRALLSKVAEASKNINCIHDEIDEIKLRYENEDATLEELEEEYASLEMRLVHLRKNSEEMELSIIDCRNKKVELTQKIKSVESKLELESADLSITDEKELNLLRREVASLTETLVSTRALYHEELSKKKSIFSQTDLLLKKREDISRSLANIEAELQLEKHNNEKNGNEMLSLSEEVYLIKERLSEREEQRANQVKVIKRPRTEV